MKSTQNIIIFASGGGSNAQAIYQHFLPHDQVNIALIVSNRPDAKVLEWAKEVDIPQYIMEEQEMSTEECIILLKSYQPDLLVLAGFLKKIPASWLDIWPNQIVNIHPALLPRFGGQGMYGMNVHRAVKQEGVLESGMTIHRVNEQYDEGAILLQAKCILLPEDEPEDIARKVLRLEHFYYPKVIEFLLQERNSESL